MQNSLCDALEALKWVKKNIGAFGGDSSRMGDADLVRIIAPPISELRFSSAEGLLLAKQGWRYYIGHDVCGWNNLCRQAPRSVNYLKKTAGTPSGPSIVATRAVYYFKKTAGTPSGPSIVETRAVYYFKKTAGTPSGQ